MEVYIIEDGGIASVREFGGKLITTVYLFVQLPSTVAVCLIAFRPSGLII